MGIYIKGMEMPKDCGKCPLVEKCKNRHLEITESDNGYEPIFIQDYCPLTEVSEPHGRLIDADALIPIMKYNTTDNEIGVFPIRIGFDAIKGVIDEAPTVIERSET